MQHQNGEKLIDNQMGKRNIADIDRIALANLKADIVGKLANKNESDGGKLAGRGRPKGSAKLPNPIVPIDTRKELAKSAGVGERTFDAGKMILEAAATGEISQADVQAIELVPSSRGHVLTAKIFRFTKSRNFWFWEIFCTEILLLEIFYF